MNRAYKEITGLSEEEASGTGHQRAIHPDGRDEPSGARSGQGHV